MALDFNGSTQGTTRASGALGMTAFPVTMACWFNPDVAPGGDITLMGMTDNAVDEALLLNFDSAGTSKLRALSRSGSSGAESVHGSAVSNTTWQHACAVWASATSRQVYFNANASTANTTSRAFPTGTLRFGLGCRAQTANDQFFNGKIAEAAVWNATLTAAEIASLAKGVSPLMIRPASLIGYWPCLRNSVNISTATLDRWRSRLDLTEANSPAYSEHPRVINPFHVL